MSTKWSFLWKRLRSAWTIPDLRKKILFTSGMLLVYGILATITVPLTRQEQVNSASLLIVVGVVLDTVRRLDAQMVMRNYSGFLL